MTARGRRRHRDPCTLPTEEDLLVAAADGRNFDVVIVESIDRLPRMAAGGTRVERDLEMLDVLPFAADEPTVTNATSILTRRGEAGREVEVGRPGQR